MNTPPKDDFAQLRRLLSIKRHEQPPPGYLHRFPAEVISSLKAERRSRKPSGASESVPLWIQHFFERLQARPALSGALGAGLCVLMIGGIVLNEQGTRQPNPMPSLLSEITPAAQPASDMGSSARAFQPVTAEGTGTLMASNSFQGSPGSSLFDSIPGIDTATVGHRP
jgi:hypothetical protein